MGKDKKKAKAQVMTLSDFVGESAGQAAAQNDMSWALDNQQWEEEETTEAGVPRKSYARSAGAMGNFREAGSHGNTRIVDYNMEKPYLGFVANLLTNLPEADVRTFFADADIGIENIKMIYKERSTFAFVEFETPQSLQLALLLEGKFLKNRPVKVDIATQDQREKMMNDKARGALGPRDAKSPVSFERGGAEQPTFSNFGDRRAPRSNTSANAPREFGDFSRDGMGSAQPELSTEFGNTSSNRRTPNSSGPAFGGGFPNFRDAEKVEQPTLERRMPRQSSKDSVGGAKAEGGAGSWRGGSKAASPNTKEPAGNWRDSAKVEQPEGSWRDQPATEQPSGDKRPKPAAPAAPKVGGEAQPAPKKDVVPKAAAPPKVSAWGSSAPSADAGSRFASLRN